jgi:hypothetical protein
VPKHIRGRSNPIIEAIEPRRMFSHTIHFTTKFADGNFAPANWSIVSEQIPAGGTQTASRVVKGGHPGAYRVVTDTVFTPAFGEDSAIWGMNVYKKGAYNPATKGAITSISYSEDSKLISGFGDGQSTGAAVLQNGKAYFDVALITPLAAWVHKTRVNLTANNFTALDGTHPNFSQTAAPMKFGFYRANSSGVSGAGYTISSAIDNFSLTIKSVKTIVKT